MDEGAREELARLRARAYGPDADIDADPEAWARLRELEERERLAPAPVDAAPIGPRDEVAASVDPDDDDEDEDDPPERRPLVRSKRGVWAWAVSLAVVTALASAATALGLTFVPVTGSADASQVDTLEPDPGADTPPVFGERTGAERAFRDYYGVTAFVGYAQVDATENRSPCIYLLDTDEVSDDEVRGLRGNFVYGGCGAGVFPATVEFVVADGMPPQFVERFPIGTSVQFVFDGENVGVFSDRG
ncbi:hypothetical protein Q9R20_10380 [Microbacterium sp. PRF11]|uniref:hypothetical protein n=1 Tax=Microbacterium sp. PRF11 TaxID=2962593 RepID=UPI002881BC53|nr:hypothetical protein [Microbacterium sp. PRF11]MDT0117396.1 hypothetical protein [Microbacterium sp. PRF11]